MRPEDIRRLGVYCAACKLGTMKPFVMNTNTPWGQVLIRAPAALRRAECHQEGCENFATHVWVGEGKLAEVPLCFRDMMRMLDMVAPLHK